MLPKFLIIGAAKSGTTSLYYYLKQHPEIFMPEWKEPHYFIADPDFSLHRVKSKKLYERLFAKANHKAVGEASTGYLENKESPRLIKNTLGQIKIKILIILRDPVFMAYSLYHHNLRKHGETLSTFESALSAEDKRRQSIEFRKKCYGYHALYYYYHFGLYYEQVKRYLETFGEENVKIFLYDDLKQDPIGITQEAYRFLGVDNGFVPEIKIHNPAGGILSIPRFWSDYGLFIKTLQFVFSKNILKKLPHLLRNIERKPPGPINPQTEQALRKRFFSDVCNLELLIKRDLSAWKGGTSSMLYAPKKINSDST